MSVNSPYSQYVENQFKTASPGKLLLMAYDAAIRFAKTAAEKMKEGRLDQQSENIRKVQNIVLELMSSLDMNVDRQLAENLYSLYSYIFDRLTHANIKDDQRALEEVIQILSELRQTWAEAELLARSGQPKLEAKAA
ncbi:MAG: flagellar export chaperone FliS [Armatimonadota bacterium]|nr:flagellar export chaperone FliS [Armatimonadota bacterium]